jgi:iron complex outermembrane receptor protein
LKRAAAAALAALLAAPVRGASSAADETLEFFEEEAQVQSASRRAQALSEVPYSVDIVTPEDIAASGAVDLWDLLRFRAGMDVLDGRSLDGNRAVVSARGFPHEFAGNLLVLVDGRSVYSANQAGIYWEQLAVALTDVERIEVVRGPNAALYGTGAGVGVVNIITKKPKGDGSAAARARAGSLGLLETSQEADAALGRVARLRVSHTHREQGSFPRAAGAAGARSDALGKNVYTGRLWTSLPRGIELETFAGGSWSTIGHPADAGGGTGRFGTDYVTVRASRGDGAGSHFEATASRRDTRSSAEFTSLTQESRQIQSDVEGLRRLSWGGGRLDTVYGAGYRNVLLTSRYSYGRARPRLEISRGFLAQSARVVDWLSLHGAASLEGTNLAGVHPNAQAAVVVRPAVGHALRASYSLAHTLRDVIPSHGDIRSDAVTRVVGDPGLAALPYRVSSWEFGHRWEDPRRAWQADTAAFYTRIDGFHQYFFDSFSTPPPLTTLRFRRYNDAIARGVEVRLARRWGAGARAYANCTWERVSDAAGDTGRETLNTPEYKLNVGGAALLPGGWTLSGDLGYKDAYFIKTVSEGTALAAAPNWRLDARLAWRLPTRADAEAFVAGKNLLYETHREFPDGLAVPRTYSAGLTVRLGPWGKP